MTRIDRADEFVRGLGLDAYRVGGSVRDELMGRKPKDADYIIRGVSLHDLGVGLAKTLDPNKIGLPKNISALKLRTGQQIGWRVSVPKVGLLEIVLPRVERSTGPGRHDFNIVVDPLLTLDSDAYRRDFTFNALYKRLEDGVVLDPTGRGLYDLEHKIINITHDSSLGDDPLRALRALRFVSTLGFELGTYTRELMKRDALRVDGLTQRGVSGTAFEELSKLLMGAYVGDALRDARDTKVLEHLLPELREMIDYEQGSKYHDMTVDEHTFKALETAAHVDANLNIRLALLFHDAGKPASAWIGPDGRKHYYAAERVVVDPDNPANEATVMTMDHEDVGANLWLTAAKRLNVPNKIMHAVETLIREHMLQISGKIKHSKLARLRVRLGDDALRDLILMRMCDVSGKKSSAANLQHLEFLAKMEATRREMVDDGVPCTLADLEIDGNDLKAMGYEGRAIGEQLNKLLDAVALQPKLNDREWLTLQASKEAGLAWKA